MLICLAYYQKEKVIQFRWKLAGRAREGCLKRDCSRYDHILLYACIKLSKAKA